MLFERVEVPRRNNEIRDDGGLGHGMMEVKDTGPIGVHGA